MKDINEMVADVKLQEMDWQNTKETAKQNIRQALVMLDVNRQLLFHAETELRRIWATMSKEERAKREADD